MPSARRNVGCALEFNFVEPSVLALQIAPPTVESEEFAVDGADEPVLAVGPNGGRTHILRAAGGTVTVRYRATTDPVVATTAIAEFDDDVLVARRQSRYCPSDVMADFARRELGPAPSADDAAAWVFERLAYELVSTVSDSAIDTLLAGRGVCRDFAHLTIAMCRAVSIPARLVSVYAPGINPMDFHAVVEVWRDGRWDVIDATRMAPRSSLVRIATGRDAADTAFAATITGDVELRSAEAFAVVEGDLPPDDHVTPVQLA